MNPSLNKSQFDQLENIKKTLGGISNTLSTMPDSEKARVENTAIGSGLSNVLKGASNVFSDLKVEKGVLTSRTAKNAVDNASKVINGGTREKSPLQLLQESNAKLQNEFAKEKATRAKLEADLSIKDQIGAAGTGAAVTDAAGKPVDPTKNQTTDETGTTIAPIENVLPGLENDEFSQFMVQHLAERTAVTNANVDRLSDYVDATDDDTASAIASLQATARGQIKRVEAENVRIAQAARVAGIVAGRGMYSPEEHEGIISEVISTGLDRVADIENTRDTAILEAKKAQREFNYKAYVEMSDMVTELSDLKRETIIDMKDRLREIETDAREKMKFDQEQADRNAFIIAPELINATPDEIYKAALANGIEPGLLAREVQAYKDDTRLTQLDIESKEESIKSERYNRYLAGLKANGTAAEEEKLEPMSKTDQEQFQGSYGWTPPFGMSFEEALRIEETFSGEPSAVKLTRAREVMVGQNKSFVELANEDIKALSESDEEMKKVIGSIGKSLGVKTIFGRAKETGDITTNPEFQSYVQQAIAEAESIGGTLSTRQMVELISEMVAQDKELEREQREKEAEEARITAQPDAFRTANTTQAVNLK